jgi:hypothetical protein
MRNPILGVSASAAAPLTYAQTVLADNPLGFWLFDETSGTTAIDQGSGLTNLIYTNSPTLNQSTGLTGITKAVSFDGTNDYAVRAETATYNFAGSSAWSLEFWIKPNNTVSNAPWTIRATSSAGTASVLLSYYMDIADGKISAYVPDSSGNSYVVLTSTNSINDNAWHQIVITAVSGGVMTLYIDGVSNASSSTARNAVGNSRALIVAANYPAGSFAQFSKGLYAANSLYTSALSQSRVTAHYNAGV